MRIVFLHQNMPGQFVHLARHFARQPGNEVVFLTKPNKAQMQGVRKVEYEPFPHNGKGPPHRWLGTLQNGVQHGLAVARKLLDMRREGFRPDIIVAHPGWGEALYAKDVFPEVPLLNYYEFFYHPFGADTFFDPAEEVRPEDIYRIRTKNTVNLLSLDAGDWGLSPTWWQWRQHPPAYRPRISVIHDGVDTRTVRPDPAATLTLPDGRVLSRQDEVITYVSRSLEPYRGFPTYMKALEILSRERPHAQFIVVGNQEGVSYGRRAPDGTSYKEMMLKEVTVDHDRVHFLGNVPYPTFLKILQVSSAHIYLTVPFVLSWSLIEALAAECLVIGSNTPPVAEVIEDGVNGLLAYFFSPDEVAERVIEGLENRERSDELRRRARRTVLERYDLVKCLPAQLRLIDDIIHRRQPQPGLAPRPAMAVA